MQQGKKLGDRKNMSKQEIIEVLEKELQEFVKAAESSLYLGQNSADISKQLFAIACYLLESNENGSMTKESIVKCLEEELQRLSQAMGFVFDCIPERCEISKQMLVIANYLLKKKS